MAIKQGRMPSNTSKHAIFLEWPLGQNKGGPSGYLWHLRRGLELSGLSSYVKFLVPEPSLPASPSVRGLVKKVLNASAYISEPLWCMLNTYGPTSLSKEYALLAGRSVTDYFAPVEWETILADPVFTSFHCHTTLNCIQV